MMALFAASSRGRARCLAACLAAVLAAQPLASVAHAQTPAQTEQAKALFNAGAQFYAIGQFAAAAQAFDEAYKLTPKPAILFSYAQAERRQYFVDHALKRLTKAVEAFRKYVAEVQTGGRRADAVAALSELEPLLDKQKAQAPAQAPEVAPQKLPARLMVTTPTPGAQVSLDGAAATEAPYVGDVKPGKHVVVVDAKGHQPARREIQVLDGGLVALDLPLEEKPASLNVRAEDGAEISIDGRLIGVAPLHSAIALPHGRHFVAVMKNGNLAWTREVDVVRGETHDVEPTLVSSTQRKVSYVVLGVGAAAFVAGGVFVGLTLHRQGKAQDIDDERARGNITPERLSQYESLRDARDRYRTMSFVALGTGAVLAVSAIFLWALDRPVAPMRDALPREKEKPTPAAAPPEISMVPLLGPSLVGGSFAIAF